jgi:phage gp16-like protein
MALKHKQIALIHVAKRELGLTDDEYRAMLNSFGVTSSKDLDNQTFDQVVNHLEKLGFRLRRGKGSSDSVPPARSPLLSKIRAQLNDLDLPWSYAEGIARRMFFNSGPDVVIRLRMLSPRQLHKVAAALTYEQRRRKAVKAAR